MTKLLPFFEVQTRKYELKPTRYLFAEYDKLMKESGMTDEEKQDALVIKEETEKFQEIAERYKQAEKEFFDDVLDESKEAVYEKFRSIHEKARERYFNLVVSDRSIDKMQQATSVINQKILLKALSEQYAMTEDEAKNIWESYENEVGTNAATEWLAYMSKYLFQNEGEDVNPFLERAKEKEAERVSKAKGLGRK